MSEVIEEAKDTLSPGVRSLLARIEAYSAKMAPGMRLTDDQINLNQKELYLVLQSILSQDSHADFLAAFNGTIELFKKYGNEALSTLHVSRNHYSIKLDSAQRRDFASWVNIFVILSKENLRKSLFKQVDAEKAYRGISEIHRIRAMEHVNRLMAPTPAA
jgi:hypothetical protein